MYDSLLSRFHAGFQGAAVGEVFLTHWSDPAAAQKRSPSIQTTQIQTTQKMLTQVDRWLQTAPKQGLGLLPNPSDIPIRLTDLALMLMPVALFYHDQPVPLQTLLRQWATQAKLTDQTALSLGVIGQIVSLTLRNRLVPTQLILQLIRDLDGLSDSALMSPLEQVQTWLEQSTSLAEVAQGCRQDILRKAAGDLSIDLSWLMVLYSFLSTPDQVQLTLRRLARLPGCQSGDAALAACLSGLYNGITGIPLGWQHWTPAREGLLPSEANLFRLADQLLAVWSGTANPQQWSQLPQHASLVASPRTIRE